MLVDRKHPWVAYEPAADFETMLYRDAGSGHNEYGLSFQASPLSIHESELR